MKNWKKVLMVSTALLLTVGLAACGKKEKATDEVPTLLMYQIGDKPENYDQLMEIANKQIEEKVGVKLNMQYIGWGDYDQKMSVIVSSGENYDIALAKNYVTNAQKGAYADLTELMPKHAKAAYDMLDEAYIQGNTINDKLYAFPVNANIFAQQMITFNKQFLDKYDLDISKVENYEDLEPLLSVIKEKEPTVMPLSAGKGFRVERDFDYVLENGLPFAVDLKGDPEKIVNQFDVESHKAGLRTMHKYYEAGYVAKDASTSNTEYPLDSATWFARQETQGPYDYGDTILTMAANQELVSKSITEPLKATANTQMASFVVSSSSKNVEKSVELLGLLNSDPELLNGLIYGIEGEAWEKVGDNRVKLLDGYGPNKHMAAWNTANNAIIYVQESITDEMIAERDRSIAEATASPILGFIFETDTVKAEISNLNNVMSQYLDGLNTGTLDPDQAIPEMNAKLKTAGYEKVLTEMQKQYDAFRAAQK